MKRVFSKRIWVDHARWISGTLTITKGKITEIREGAAPVSSDCEDFGELTLIPGLVDTHVHINEPGRTEWEGFATATQAAAAGGITTLTDMPLNCIPVTTSLQALEAKRDALAGKLSNDCSFHGGIVPGNTKEIAGMVQAGVKTFKCFMIDSGIPEFGWVSEEQLRPAMKELARCGATLLAHAEVQEANDAELNQSLVKNPESYAAFLDSRPTSMENRAIRTLIRLAKETGCPVHIVHLSSADALADIKKAKADGVAITCETCPHYLLLNAARIPNGDGRFKCCPPIRDEANQDALWKGLLEGVIDFVVSDHSPCTPELKLLKEKNLRDAWGGISSLQFGLQLMWHEAVRRTIPLERVVHWMSAEPAKLVKVDQRKGRLSVGFDADFVVFAPNDSHTIARADILHRHKETPYEGWMGRGVVKETWLRGERIYANKTVVSQPIGRTLP